MRNFKPALALLFTLVFLSCNDGEVLSPVLSSSFTLRFNVPNTLVVNSYVNIAPVTDCGQETSCVIQCTISPQLPSGLTLDPATCAISGSPTQASGTTVYTVTATNNSGESAEAQFTIIVNDPPVMIAPNLVLVDLVELSTYGPFALNPTSDSPGGINYQSSNVAVAKINGDVVTIVGVGLATITANQASSGNYAAASTTAKLNVYTDVCEQLSPCENGASCSNVIPNRFICTCAIGYAGSRCESGTLDPGLSLGDITKLFNAAPFSLSPTTQSSGALSYQSSDTTVATINSNVVTIVSGGSVTITVNQAADGPYIAASTTATLNVLYPDWCATDPCGLNGVCTRVLPNSYSCSCNLGFYGTNCEFIATGIPTISLSDINVVNTDPPITLSPTSNSAGAFSYVSGDTTVATISGSTLTIVGTGSTTITVNQAANGAYLAGSTTAALNVYEDMCTVNPCLNGGSCTNVIPNSYSCSCTTGFSGATCQDTDTNCNVGAPGACLNGGSCVADTSGGTCQCTTCYLGLSCEFFDIANCAI